MCVLCSSVYLSVRQITKQTFSILVLSVGNLVTKGVLFCILLTFVVNGPSATAQSDSSLRASDLRLLVDNDSLLSPEEKFELHFSVSKQSKHVTREFLNSLEPQRKDLEDVRVELGYESYVLLVSRQKLLRLIQNRVKQQ